MATFDFTSDTRTLDKVLRWNTLDDAASLLSALTGEAWTPRRILSDVLDGYRVPQGKTQPPTCLRCAPPRSTKFARYKWDTENGTPSNPFVYVCAAPYQTVALYPAQVDELLKTGEAAISIAERPEDDYGRPGEYVFIEPPEEALTVALPSIGMSAAGLQEFAARVMAECPKVTSATPPPDSRVKVEDAAPAAVENRSVTKHSIKARRNVLDRLIDRAVASVGSEDTQAVFLVLKEAALAAETPFTGEVKGGKLFYTTLDDELDYLNSERLRHRLKPRKRAATGGNGQ
ncbi:hypothetical protein [Burkholderia sp. BCC1993]|uniref:hypothetical protein n=1 Tax=Burkholderia sp. BCC1993 TaxID=2817444 RepID=UPI002AB21EC4|nr:hypothetical protein [Burkholderia sp. BCC1993]